MKPRSNRERQVVRLSAKLKPLSQAQKQWAISHIFTPTAYASKKHAWCSECGNAFSHVSSGVVRDIVGETTNCPHCGKTLKFTSSRRHIDNVAWYMTVLTTVGGFQVCRHFFVTRCAAKGKAVSYEFREAVQNWIDSTGNEVVLARKVRWFSRFIDDWDFSSPLSLKRHGSKYKYTSGRYKIWSDYVCPYGKVLPKLRRNGFKWGFSAFSLSELYKLLLKDGECERLLKNGQIELLKYKHRHDDVPLPYQHAVRIAIRHHYIVPDAPMWMDYLRNLERLGYDTHNPHYICPPNLKEAHDRVLAKWRKQRVRIEAAQYEKAYQDAKAKFFGICFGDENITVAVISSVREMAEEGAEMHHCVYANQYFLKPDSLILSARDKQGHRIETIEVSLKTFEVVQSRGVCNRNTEYHDRIIRLVKENINLIKQVA